MHFFFFDNLIDMYWWGRWFPLQGDELEYYFYGNFPHRFMFAQFVEFQNGWYFNMIPRNKPWRKMTRREICLKILISTFRSEEKLLCKSFGQFFDKSLTVEKQCSSVARSWYMHIYRIDSICPFIWGSMYDTCERFGKIEIRLWKFPIIWNEQTIHEQTFACTKYCCQSGNAGRKIWTHYACSGPIALTSSQIPYSVQNSVVWLQVFLQTGS